MSSKKTTNTTQTTSAAPWAQPYINDSLSGLQNASNQSQANSAAVQPYLMSAIQNLGSGTPDFLKSASDTVGNIASGSQVGSNPYATSLTNNPYTSDIANGDSGGYYAQALSNASDTNPYLQQMGQQVADQTGSSLASSFGGAGRSGGGLASLLGAQGVGNALGNFYGTQYNNDQQLRQQALLAAAQAKASGLADAANLTQSGNQAAASLYDTQQARQLSAAGLAPSLYSAGLAGDQELGSLSSIATLLPLQGASAYSSGVTGATSPYTTTNGTQTQTTSGLGQIIGPALGLAGALTGSGGLSGLFGGSGGSGMSGLLGGTIPSYSAPNISLLAGASNPYGNGVI